MRFERTMPRSWSSRSSKLSSLMNCFQTLEESSLNTILSDNSTIVLFKHSTRCSISSTALHRLQGFCNELKQPISAYIIDVISQRDLSNEIATLLNIKHESPQLFVLKDGKLQYHNSHFGINKADLIKTINEVNLLV